MSTFRLRPIVRAHHDSLARPPESRRRALVVLYAPAIATGVCLTIAELARPSWVDLGAGFTEPLAGALALLAGVLFSIGVVILDKSIDLDLAGPEPDATTNRAAERLQALSANALYASLVAGALVGLVLLGSLVSIAEVPLAIAGAAGIVLLGTTGMLVTGRVFAETTARTDRVRSGESHRRAGSNRAA